MKLCYKPCIYAFCFTLLAAACVLQMRGLDYFKPIPGTSGRVQSKMAGNGPNAVPDSTMASIQQSLAQREYHLSFDSKKNALQSPNRKQGLRAYYKPGVLTIKNRVDSAGHNFSLKLVNEGIFADGKKILSAKADAALDHTDNELQIKHNGFTEEFINNEAGVRQNFIIDTAPNDTKELEVRLSAKGLTVNDQQNNELYFCSKDKEGNVVNQLVYRDIKCWDANGRTLPATLRYDNNLIALTVAVEGAAYPVTIDPIISNGNPTNANMVLESDEIKAQAGYSVSSAGDVNGDGFDDVLVGAPFYDFNENEQDAGAVFVYLGSPAGIKIKIEDVLADGQSGSQFGTSVSAVGDINKDGFDDVIIGAPMYSNGQSKEGVAFVYMGSDYGLWYGDPILLEGNQPDSKYGRAVSGLGDVNGDGFTDVIVGASSFDKGENDEGVAFIYHGSAQGISTVPAVTLESNQPTSYFGCSVAAAGDVNKDGFGDVLIGATHYDNGQKDEGVTFVYHGSAAGVGANAAAILEVNQISAAFGWSVASAGDVNGDGFADIIVGSYLYDNGQSNEGAAFIYHGSGQGINKVAALKLESNQAEAKQGISVASAGDVNGDGYSDVLIGIWQFDKGESNEGAVVLHHGSASGVRAIAASIFEGNQANAAMGWSVRSAGDVNADGFSDIIIGANMYDKGEEDEGAAFVWLGSPDVLPTNGPITASGNPANANAVLESNQGDAQAGYAVSSAGDINGDGYSDVLVGAPFYDKGESNEGAVLVYHGSASGLSLYPAIILESNKAEAQFGTSVSAAGDINKDGISDIIVGAPYYSNGQANEGVAIVYYGSATGLKNNSFTILEANQPDSRFGRAVEGLGDVNGDGFSDVVVGASSYDKGQNDEGAAFVFHGAAQGISTNPAVTLEANQATAYFGGAVAAAGDVNGDGFGDVLVGATHYDNGHKDEGATFVYHGSAAGVSANAAAILDINQASAAFGWAVSSAGDVNGDGYADVVVGSYMYDNVQVNEGAAFVYHGSAQGIKTAAALKLESNQPEARQGISVACAGDVNGDGYSDILVGIWQYDKGESNEGAVVLHHGSATGIKAVAASMFEGNQANAALGWSVKSAGDVNGDGYSDIIAGANMYDQSQDNEGAALVWMGMADGTSSIAAVKLEGNQEGAQFGCSVASAGDVNGDGYGDVVVGAHLFDKNGKQDKGAAFVYYGSQSGISANNITELDGSQAAYSEYGKSVTAAGDVNGDGFGDVAVSSGHLAFGTVCIYHGSAVGITAIPATAIKTPTNQLDYFGKAVAGVGDVNQDGYADIIISATQHTVTIAADEELSPAGAVYVYHGSSNGIVAQPSSIILGTQEDARFAWSISGAGDVNGDGFNDIAIGAEYHKAEYEPNPFGAVFVYHGSVAGVMAQPAVKIIGSNKAHYIGRSIANAGDVNGDGYSDILVSIKDIYDFDGSVAELYYGSATGIQNVAAARFKNNFTNSSGLNVTVSGAGDVNGDGYGDVILAASEHDVNGQTDVGDAFIHYGSAAGMKNSFAIKIEGDQQNGFFASSIACAGDVNGDGYSDIIAGSHKYDNGEINEGIAQIFYGNQNKNLRNNPRLYNSNLTSPISQSQKGQNDFGVGIYAKSFLGGGKGKLVWETKAKDQGFSKGANNMITTSTQSSGSQVAYNALGLAGTELKSVVSKQGPGTKVRVRVKYDRALALTGQLFGPWRYLPASLLGTSNAPAPEEVVDDMSETAKRKVAELTAEELIEPLYVYPNPASDRISIAGKNADDVKSVKILTWNGKTVYSTTLLTKDIDIRSLAAGNYLLLITNRDGSVTTRKIIVTQR